ncbi:MAG: hypothetical protein ABI175_29270 [Polyangiales bacterium]
MMEGTRSYCTACRGERPAFSAPVVNLAGKPTKAIGIAARIAGWGVLLLGLTAALVLGTLLQAIFPAAILGWVLGIALAVVAVACGVLLLRGGKHLAATGATHSDAERGRALAAFAATHGGVITALDAARVLNLTLEEADGAMMGLARRGNASVENDDQGNVYYRLDESMLTSAADAAFEARSPSHVRVDPFLERLRVGDQRSDQVTRNWQTSPPFEEHETSSTEQVRPVVARSARSMPTK